MEPEKRTTGSDKQAGRVRTFWREWGTIVVFAIVIFVGIDSVLYARHVAQQNNKQWCDVVDTLDDAYHQQPPTTAIGQKLAFDMKALRIKFECPQNPSSSK